MYASSLQCLANIAQVAGQKSAPDVQSGGTAPPAPTAPLKNQHRAVHRRPFHIQEKDLPPEIHRAYETSDFSYIVKTLDDDYILNSGYDTATLLVIKGDALSALHGTPPPEAANCFLRAARCHTTEQLPYWAYHIRAALLLDDIALATTHLAEAESRFPNDLDVWAMHVWVHGKDTPYEYFVSLPLERRQNKTVIGSTISTAYTGHKYKDVIGIVEQCPVKPEELPLEAQLLYASARINIRLPSLASPISQRSSLDIEETMSLLRRIRSEAKDEQIDLKIEATLFILDCLKALGWQHDHDLEIDKATHDFGGHWAIARARYLGLIEIDIERAIALMSHLRNTEDDRQYAIVSRDLASAKLLLDKEGANRSLVTEADDIAKSAQSRLPPGNPLYIRETLLQTRITAHRHLHGIKAALAIVRDDLTCSFPFRATAELALLLSTGSNSDGQSFYTEVRERLLQEIYLEPDLTKNYLARNLTLLGEFEDALSLLPSEVDSNLSRDDASALSYCQVRKGDLQGSFDTLAKYQKAHGCDSEMCRTMYGLLHIFDPDKVLAFFGSMTSLGDLNLYSDWELFANLLRLGRIFGWEVDLTTEGVHCLASATPPEFGSVLAERIIAIGNPKAAVLFSFSHLHSHYNTGDAKIAFFQSMAYIREKVPDYEKHLSELGFPKVYRITGIGSHALHYCKDELPLLSHVVQIASHGSRARSLIDAYTSSDIVGDGEVDVVEIDVVNYLMIDVMRQMEALAAGSSAGLIEILPDEASFIVRLEESRRQEHDAREGLKAALVEHKDPYVALHATGERLSAFDMLLVVGSHKNLAIAPGRLTDRSDRIRANAWDNRSTTLVVDFLSFAIWWLFSNGRTHLLEQLKCKTIAAPSFFREFDIVRRQIERTTGDRVGIVDGQATVFKGAPLLPGLDITASSIRRYLGMGPTWRALGTKGSKERLAKLGHQGVDTISAAIHAKIVSPDARVVVLSDSIEQRCILAELGLDSICTGDILEHFVRTGKVTRRDSILIRTEMVSGGYAGADIPLTDGNLNLLAMLALGNQGATIFDRLARAATREGVETDRIAFMFARIAKKVMGFGGAKATVSLERLVNQVGSLADEIDDNDFRTLFLEAAEGAGIAPGHISRFASALRPR